MAHFRTSLLVSVGLFVGSACSSSEDGAGKGGGQGGDGSGIFGSNAGGTVGGGVLLDGGLDDLRNAACASESAATEAAPSVIQFIIDTSGSMGQDAPGSNNSKWEITRDALLAAMDSIPGSTGVGMLFYPNRNTVPSDPDGTETDPERPVTECVDGSNDVPIELLGGAASAHRADVGAALRRVRPEGGTPTHDAFRLGLDPIRNTTLPGPRYIVLITDGQPTFLSGCRGTGNVSDPVDPRPIVDEVVGAAGEGLKTFVIGSPGSEAVGVPIFADARTWLSQAANRGGTARPSCSDDGPTFCHFDMSQEADFAQALQDALRLILGTVLSCDYALPPPPSGETLDTERVNVILTTQGRSEIIPRASANTCTPGLDAWRYSDDGQRIEFCSQMCDRLKTTVGPQVDVLFGCTTVGGIR